MITHYDLFAGIGGFSLALEEVFNDPVRHIFCEWESFPTSVLRRHWPDGEFYGDIADLVAYTEREGRTRGDAQHQATRYHDQPHLSRRNQKQEGLTANSRSAGLEEARTGQPTEGRGRGGDGLDFTIVTGGFPCQPFSAAGRRKGTADDRYQWPNMFEVIRHTKPEWVIAENVRGLVTWNDGMVLETVCADLESEGYEVQPFIIPAVAVGAPHRRDRVWIIGRNTEHSQHDGLDGTKNRESTYKRNDGNKARTDESKQPKRPDSLWQGDAETDDSKVSGNSADLTAHPERKRSLQRSEGKRPGYIEQSSRNRQDEAQDGRIYPDWNRNWQEVAFATCNDTVDARFPSWLDGLPVDVYGTMMVYGQESYTRRIQDLPSLQASFSTPKVREQIRGLFPFSDEEILYEVVRQLERGLEPSQELSTESLDGSERSMFAVWCEEIRRQADKRSSQGRRLIEQRAEELRNIVPELSHEVTLELMEAGYCLWQLYSTIHPKAVVEPRLVAGVSMSRSKWRQNSLKAYGNGIVPEVAMNIMAAIKESIQNK